jgi:hypothetical protein
MDRFAYSWIKLLEDKQEYMCKNTNLLVGTYDTSQMIANQMQENNKRWNEPQ